MSTPAPVLAAWQDALAAEHAAIYGYGTLGPRLPAGDRPLARIVEAEHRVLRERTEASIAALGAVPVSAQASYLPSAPISSAAAAQQMALALENACSSAWRFLLATAAAPTPSATPGDATERAARTAGQTSLTASAVRAMRWRLRTDPAHPTEAFPGL